jgi:alkylation response protein AidB-like acyl-CoA dehydrogenase
MGRLDDPGLWSNLAALDVFGLAVPEELGGTDVDAAGLRIFLEEAGRCLLPAPYLTTVFIAPMVLRRLRGPDGDGLLAQIAKGQSKVGVTIPTESPAKALTATGQGSRWTVSGCTQSVLDGETADWWLVVAQTESGPAMFVVEAGSDGCVCEPLRSVDHSRPTSRLRLESSPALMLTEATSAAPAISELTDLVRLALAADAVGGAMRLLEMTVEYSRTRTQFGRPIGQFQAIKHQCADLFVAIQGASATVDAAFAQLGSDRRASAVPVMLASIAALDAYAQAASTAMQLHGGLSFTWEHEAHLYLKRVTASQHLLGNPDRELARLTDMVLDDGYDIVQGLLG